MSHTPTDTPTPSNVDSDTAALVEYLLWYAWNVADVGGEPHHKFIEAATLMDNLASRSADGGDEEQVERDEEIGICVGCCKSLRVGEVVTAWDDEIGHYNCRDPFSLARQLELDADPDTPPPVVLLGSPSRYLALDVVLAALEPRLEDSERVVAALSANGFYHHSPECHHGEMHEVVRQPSVENVAPVIAAMPLRSAVQGEGEAQEVVKKDAFTQGYLLAVSNIVNLHGEDVVAEDVLDQLGETEGCIKRLDLCDYDAKPLRKLFRGISQRKKATRQLGSKTSG